MVGQIHLDPLFSPHLIKKKTKKKTLLELGQLWQKFLDPRMDKKGHKYIICTMNHIKFRLSTMNEDHYFIKG